MKKHLFYTFLTIFAVTAMVTLLGVTGALRIRDGYLTALVTAFLVELAGAVVAIFRSAEFFKDDEQTYLNAIARLKQEHADADERRRETASVTGALQDEINQLKSENQKLREDLEQFTSLRLKILAVLGSISADRAMILRELNLAADSREGAEVLSVIGKLVHDQEIEPDSYKPSGHYRLKRS